MEIRLQVDNSVYEPREDSWLLANEVKQLSKGKRVLDIGCGTGIQAITAALSGASEVWACDINPKAVECTKKNAKLNKVKIKAFKSDLFKDVPSKKFDLIVFNPPYLPSDGKNDDIRWSGGYEGMEVILNFFAQASPFISKNGKVLFIFSSHTNQEKLKKTLQQMGFNLKILSKKRMFFEEIYVALVNF